ncbi:unnamed protein product, partial [Ascophyllum nodosum]
MPLVKGQAPSIFRSCLRSVLLALLYGLAGLEPSKAQCDPGELNWTVASALDTYNISK